MLALQDSLIEIYIPVFILIGLATFSLRALFLFKLPDIMDNPTLKKGLDSIPSSLLVALVIPFTFFVNGVFLPLRIEVLVVLVTIPIVWLLKKPSLSLPIALVLFLGLNFLF